MNGIRFYLEYPNKTEKNKATVKNLGKHSGTVLAVYIGQWIPGTLNIEVTGAIQDHPNSPVCYTSASMDYIRERCKRIPERLVNDIHPNLYQYLIN